MMRQVLIDGKAIDLEADRPDVRQVEPGVYSVLRNGQSFEVRITSEAAHYLVEVAGRKFRADVRDPRNAASRTRTSAGAGLRNITALMPGKVVRVLVAEGQTVESGQGLVVVEAMKMQNEMKASKPGRILKVNAREGQTVVAGEVLLQLE